MFYLSKSDDTWTLSYEVGGLRACLDDRWRSSGSLRRDIPNHRCLCIPRYLVEHHAVCSPVPRSRGYWVMSDSATKATFDLAKKRVCVHSERPWFGPTRSFAFSDVAAIRAVNRSGETVDSWEACIEFHDGTTIRLGRENDERSVRLP